MSRLLLIACSQRKRPAPGKLPAIERYDGPAFRVLRRYLREQNDFGLWIYVLSAEFGLIHSQERIPYYQRRMTAQRAADLESRVCRVLETILSEQPWREIGVCLGRDYMPALARCVENLSGGLDCSLLGGGLGRRLSALKRWLHKSSDNPADDWTESRGGKGVEI